MVYKVSRVTPDPAGLAAVDPGNPQTWNRYAYVANNPLSFTDPSGLTDCPQGKTCPIPVDPQPPVTVTGTPDPIDPFTVSGCGLFSIYCAPDFPHQPSQPTGAANNGPVVVKNPCQFQGRALPPGAYATSGQQAQNGTTDFALDVAMGFPAGHYLDPQPLASGNAFQRQAYGNYTFGVYMAAAGVSLNTALSGANTYAFFFSSYSKNTPMDPNHGSLPAASVANITNGYNAYASKTKFHALIVCRFTDQ